MWVNLSWFKRISRNNKRFARKICIFHMFWQFFMLKSESLTSLFRSFLISELSHSLPSLFFLKRELSDSLPSLFTNNRPEWLAQVAHIKRAKVRFAQKTSDLLEKPISEFPTLLCLFALIKETVYQDIRPFFPKTLHLGHLVMSYDHCVHF